MLVLRYLHLVIFSFFLLTNFCTFAFSFAKRSPHLWEPNYLGLEMGVEYRISGPTRTCADLTLHPIRSVIAIDQELSVQLLSQHILSRAYARACPNPRSLFDLIDDNGRAYFASAAARERALQIWEACNNSTIIANTLDKNKIRSWIVAINRAAREHTFNVASIRCITSENIITMMGIHPTLVDRRFQSSAELRNLVINFAFNCLSLEELTYFGLDLRLSSSRVQQSSTKYLAVMRSGTSVECRRMMFVQNSASQLGIIQFRESLLQLNRN